MNTISTKSRCAHLNKFRLGRKAQESFTMLQAIPRILFLIIVASSVIFLVRQFVVDSLDVKEVQAEIFTNRILYSPNGILYHDIELRSSISGTIDASKITNENLDNLIKYNDDSFIAAKIQLFDMEKAEVVSAKYNNKKYDDWITIARFPVSGEGGVTQINKTKYISYFKEGEQKQGVLKFNILLPGK